jgi:AraC-like DNA-binding protein
MIHYRYQQGDLVDWQENLAKLLGVEKKHNCITFPEHAGEGFFYASPLLRDMSLLYANVVFKQDFLFDRLPSEDGGVMLYFNQVEIQGEYKVTSGDQVLVDRNQKRNTTFLGSTQFPWQLKYTAGTHLRAIAVRFGEKLVKSFVRAEKFDQFEDYTKENLANAEKEQLTPELMKILNEIYQSDISTILGQLVLHNRTLLLVEKFLQNFILHHNPNTRNSRMSKDDLERLALVEDVLSQEIDNFPTIEKLSRMAMMSSTKLKKRFKEVYGMKLYEFYNHNRLQKAKSMLASGEASVKEAALRIGFANLSNFSKAFKKEFGFLPKQSKSVETHLPS